MMLRLSRATAVCLFGVLFLVGCAPADTPEDMLIRAKAATDAGDTARPIGLKTCCESIKER